MDPTLTEIGSSLKVPCVQEMVAKEPLMNAVPARYVRPDQHPPFIINLKSASSDDDDTTNLPQPPTINLQNLLSGDLVDSELDKLHQACKEWGFFQLINHGVSSTLVEKVKLETEEFFKLPIEEKNKFWQEPGELEGFGQAFVVSEEQKLDWADIFYMVTLPTYLRKPRLLPKLPLPFRDTMEAYSAELKNLAMKILGLMAKALRMEKEHMRELFEEGRQAMRMNYYPPCPQPELVMGLSSHSDSGGLTILLQVSDVDGLQIKKNGMWIPVKPLPGAFVVNIGDMLEIVSNGIYQSIDHRATVNSETERLSIATFLSPRLDGDLGPAPSLITPQTPPLFRRTTVADYYKGYFSRQLNGKSYLDVMRIQIDQESKSN